MKLIVPHLPKNLSIFYVSLRFITVFRIAHHWFLSRATWISLYPRNVFVKILFKITLAFSPRSFTISLPLGSCKNCVYISDLSDTCYIYIILSNLDHQNAVFLEGCKLRRPCWAVFSSLTSLPVLYAQIFTHHLLSDNNQNRRTTTVPYVVCIYIYIHVFMLLSRRNVNH
jgi:hypothetical protein